MLIELKDFCEAVVYESSQLHGIIQNIEKSFLEQANALAEVIITSVTEQKSECSNAIQAAKVSISTRT